MTSTATKTTTSSVPKIRFPGYSDCWSEKRIDQIYSFVRNGFVGTATPFYVSAGHKYIQGKDIQKGKIQDTVNVFVSDNFYNSHQNSILRTNDLIMVQSGHAGECATVSEKYDGSNCHAILIMTSDIPVVSEFYVNYFHTTKGKKALYRIKTGNTIEHILASDIKVVTVPDCQHEEQQKVARFLASVDSWIDNLRSQKESLETYKKSVMQKIFAQEVRFKDDARNNYPDWEEKRLEDMGTISGGGTPDTSKQEYWNGSINWFTPSEIKEKYASNSFRKISLLGLKNSSAKLLPIGSLLFTSRATVGEISISLELSTTNQGFQSVTANNKTSNEFLYYWMKYSKNKFLRKSNGSTFLEISSKEMKSLKDAFPSLPEQQKIASFLSSIDKLIKSKDDQIKGAKVWKKGLLQQMFV